ncbi:unnamed protein product [Trypanosoma congolense IL3000]|uniref:WGS project CAEQ00000000 data, annotated contig 1873 n=1 Tax=Trypanosoma congolense (strain IL3000) TaxID=1068625 RepID=F9W9L6_TRYCI|nr:unnamed protein product [Trypanosoma congolense IL3000]
MPLHIHMVVRTQDPKKKRKGNNQPNASNNNSGNGGMEESLNQATLKERSALFLEKEAEAAPGQMVGFVNFVQVQTALQSSTAMQCGYRLFNAAEGRLIFQCAINLLNRDDAPQAESSDTKATTDPKSSKGGDPSQAIESLKREAASGAQQTPATEASAASAIEEKRRKELERAIQKLERGETQDREAIKKLWSSAHRHLADEYNKACQRAAQKKKERERKTLLAKVGPSPELQRELNSLMQTVATHTNQVTKLMKEKAKEEENMQKLKQRIEDGNRELKTLRQQLKSHGETLANINEEINVLTNRKQEREELRRLKAPDLSAALHIPEPGATRHETLAINDFQSFWATSAPRGSSPQVMMDLPASTHSTPQRHSPGQVATVAHAISPVDGGSNSSNAGGPSIPLPRSAVMFNGGCSYPQTVSGGTSSADYFSGGLPSWGSLADALSFTATCNDSSNGGVFGVANSTVPTCSTSPQQQRQKSIDISQLASELCDETPATQSKADPSAGGGFTVTAHFSAPEQASRFMLDVNAHPYTPTPLTSSQATGVAVLHSNFTNAPLLHLSPSTKSPSSAYVGSASPPSGGGVFPEKPRYTSVSTPVATSGSTGNNGLFGVAPFGILGSSNGSLGCRPDSGPLLNFTTAPWN